MNQTETSCKSEDPKYIDPLPIPNKPEPSVYESVAARRSGFDSMMWQTPVLSLTAQAFLLTIVLGEGSTPFARVLSGALSFIAAFASIQLMMKHRHMENRDAAWLEGYEKKHFNCAVHGKPIYRCQTTDSNWLGKRWKALQTRASPLIGFLVRSSSYRLWVVTLGAFGFVAFIAVLIALFKPNWLSDVCG